MSQSLIILQGTKNPHPQAAHLITINAHGLDTASLELTLADMRTVKRPTKWVTGCIETLEYVIAERAASKEVA